MLSSQLYPDGKTVQHECVWVQSEQHLHKKIQVFGLKQLQSIHLRYFVISMFKAPGNTMLCVMAEYGLQRNLYDDWQTRVHGHVLVVRLRLDRGR